MELLIEGGIKEAGVGGRRPPYKKLNNFFILQDIVKILVYSESTPKVSVYM